ncbi:uncharacterized protein LOC110694703 [Chenopodium quinoa]|nr:uncharacterized protein LOC110694703 [Chenopodium quinoa]
MAAISSDHTIADHLKCRKPRNHHSSDPNNPQMPSIIQSTRCKSSISSLLLSTFSTNHETSKFTPKTRSLRGFGCAARPEVTVPGVIRSSADWETSRQNKSDNKNKNNNNCNNNNDSKKKKKKNGKKKNVQQLQGALMEDPIGVQDLWCGDASAAASVDCVRPLSNNFNRGKIDLDKLQHRERASYSRQRVNAEQFAAPGLDFAFDIPPFGPDVFEARYYHHLRNRSPEGLAEILMFQNGLLTGRRSGSADRYRDLRLDVDNMTYEELLELGDRIGHVSTGLGDDQIGRCLRKTKLSILNELPSQSHISADIEGKCSICQDEYEVEEEVGKLECGHAYHLHCIKQWLVRKNACPVCKAEASSL